MSTQSLLHTQQSGMICIRRFHSEIGPDVSCGHKAQPLCIPLAFVLPLCPSGNKFAYIIGAVAVVALTSGVAVGALSQPSSTELYAPAATTVRSGVQAAAPITRMGSARQASAAFGAAAAPAAGMCPASCAAISGPVQR